MAEELSGWKRCNTCKGDIPFEAEYYVCSVSTCNRGDSPFIFCSVECWDAHVPVMRHREAWAVEERAPTAAAWAGRAEAAEAEETEEAEAEAEAEDEPDDAEAPARPRGGPAPREILIVASKLKAYVRSTSGMNTSDSVMEVLSERLRRLCDGAVARAREAGRKTVMDRDFR